MISIIIPCYNSERFIARTLNMLISQGLEDYELIAINDGSTDGTSKILHEYKAKITHFTVIDKKNEGVSVARNVGIQLAKGKYIYFLDSDDSLIDGTLSYYNKVLTENPLLPFYCFGYKSVKNGKTKKKYITKKFDNQILSNNVLEKNFLTKKFYVHICSCLCERNFLQTHNTFFTKGLKIGEDLEFLLTVMHNAEKAFYSSRLCYIYQLRNDSAMHGYTTYSLNQFNSFVVVRKFLVQNNFGNVYERNFFIANLYVLQLFFYLKSDISEKDISTKFISYKGVLSTPTHGRNLRTILIKVINFIGIQKLLTLFDKDLSL